MDVQIFSKTNMGSGLRTLSAFLLCAKLYIGKAQEAAEILLTEQHQGVLSKTFIEAKSTFSKNMGI